MELVKSECRTCMSYARAKVQSKLVRFSLCFFFFFSSRRRHTRFDCDWSSDVCSSDLCTPTVPGAIGAFRRDALEEVGGVSGATLAEDTDLTLAIGRTGRRIVYAEDRSEERRVGKECRSRWSPYH